MSVSITRKIFVTSLLTLSVALTGCVTDSKTGSTAVTVPVITLQPSNQTVATGATATFTVTATGNALSYQWMKGAVNLPGDTLATLTLSGLLLGDAGSYKCVVSNTAGSATSTVVVLTVQLSWPVATVQNLGAQAHPTLGSALDLDAASASMVMTSSVANANLTKIDLVFLYYGTSSHLDGAAAARDSGIKYNINLTNTYGSTVKDVMMLKVNAKPASQEAGKAAYDAAGSALIRSTAITSGDMFVVKTTGGNYVYLVVTAVAGTNAGTADLSISVGTL